MAGCGATCGINREREREREAAFAAVARAYPGLVWHDRAPLPMGLDPDAIVALGQKLEELLPVRAVFCPGDCGSDGSSAGCDWLYLLAGFAAPCLIERAHGASASMNGAEDNDAARASDKETYVRLGFSPLGPYVTLQEVVVRATPPSVDAPGVITIEPQIGIADRRLQAIVKGLQGKLRRERLIVLDMAFLAKTMLDVAKVGEAPPQPAFARAFGSEPSLFSFLFDAAPPGAARAVFERGVDAADPSE